MYAFLVPCITQYTFLRLTQFYRNLQELRHVNSCQMHQNVAILPRIMGLQNLFLLLPVPSVNLNLLVGQASLIIFILDIPSRPSLLFVVVVMEYLRITPFL